MSLTLSWCWWWVQDAFDLYIFIRDAISLKDKAEQAMEAAGFMSATQLPKVAGGEEGKGGGVPQGRGRVGNPFLVVELQLPL